MPADQCLDTRAAPTQAERKTKKDKSIRDALPRKRTETSPMLFCSKDPAPCSSDTEDRVRFDFMDAGQRNELLQLALGLHALLVVQDLLADAQVLRE